MDLSHLDPDPLVAVRAYASPADLEVAGLLAAGLAFGGAATILASSRRALAALGPSPAAAADGASPAELRRALRGFRHRWIDGDDVADLVAACGALRRRHGSLEAAFAAGDPGGADVGGALAAFAAELRAAAPRGGAAGVRALVPSPAEGSACKRPLLFLRWMCRPAGIDTGAWSSPTPARLVLPLDTHVARITRALGLLRRRATDWRAALEATAALRRFDAADPVKYDYALCRLGILDLCPSRRDPVNCARCGLFDVCRFPTARERSR
jgi:uncharacterized protein (TIGR02757 family)